jgi:glycosyltransferase involved in cell wall biosynthesis
MRVLLVTSEWPTEDRPWAVPFIVRQVAFLRQAGLEVDVFPFKGRRNPLRYLGIYRRLRRQLRRGGYDVVHAHFGHSGLLAGVPKRLPLVVTFQGTDLHGIYTAAGRYHPLSYPLRLMMQLVAHLADEVVVVSEHMARFLWRRDYHVIPGGLDLSLFHPLPRDEARGRVDLPLDERLVLFVGGRDNAVKRYDLAERVVAALDPALGARLLVLNGVVPDRVPLYLNAADALLVTSKHEGSPNVVKEAMACNLPIVSVDVGDVRERLRDVTGCAVVASDEPPVIARSLARVLRRGERTNGWEVAQQLSEPRLVERQIAVYKCAIERYYG